VQVAVLQNYWTCCWNTTLHQTMFSSFSSEPRLYSSKAHRQLLFTEDCHLYMRGGGDYPMP
jgi:hypothetical protein